MANLERMKIKDLVDLLNKYPDNATVELDIGVDWCDNYGGGSARLTVVYDKEDKHSKKCKNGKKYEIRDIIMEVEE